ncbi:hypothetical protein COCON_G00128820 [Conger conger]|uniref:Uncharacterized protein n=1 Tax=Conger conger TaxID=82655 RepID=A0A9Q1DEF0_CONCO|nr:hypothetical protein COCON_G00128820 [Conger conger]
MAGATEGPTELHPTGEGNLALYDRSKSFICDCSAVALTATGSGKRVCVQAESASPSVEARVKWGSYVRSLLQEELRENTSSAAPTRTRRVGEDLQAKRSSGPRPPFPQRWMARIQTGLRSNCSKQTDTPPCRSPPIAKGGGATHCPLTAEN